MISHDIFVWMLLLLVERKTKNKQLLYYETLIWCFIYTWTQNLSCCKTGNFEINEKVQLKIPCAKQRLHFRTTEGGKGYMIIRLRKFKARRKVWVKSGLNSTKNNGYRHVRQTKKSFLQIYCYIHEKKMVLRICIMLEWY